MQFMQRSAPAFVMGSRGVAYRKSGPWATFSSFSALACSYRTASQNCEEPLLRKALPWGSLAHWADFSFFRRLRPKGSFAESPPEGAAVLRSGPGCWHPGPLRRGGAGFTGPSRSAPRSRRRPRVFPPAFLFAYGESRGPWPRPPAAHTSPSSGIRLRYRKERKSPAP